MKYLHISLPLALATPALFPASASAAPPVLNCPTTAPTPMPTKWPAWARPPETSAADFVLDGAEKRTNIWNSFGEFQTALGRYVHTGIDINTEYDETGDFAVVAQDGHLFATHTYDQLGCVSATNCKLYIRTADLRYIYYYAHLELRPEGEDDMKPDVSSAMRARVAIAAAFPNGEQDVTKYNSTVVTAGEIVSAIAIFSAGQSHLHFSIIDACENFDGLSPLDWLQGTAHPGYEDKEVPLIDGLSLVSLNDNTLVDHTDDHCQTVSEDFDIVAEVRDVWDGNTSFFGNDALGTRESRYTIFNQSTQSVELPSSTWYRFDMVPFRCSGPLRGNDCMTDTMALTGVGGFLDEVNLFNFGQGDPDFIGPILAHPFAEKMYRDDVAFNSDSFEDPAVYFQTLNHEWGVISPSEAAEQIQVGMGGLQDAHYQVSVETFDQAGNGAVRSVFFKTGTPDPRTDLLIRDNLADSGAIPSTLGGNKHHRSPDIQVRLASAQVTLDPDDPSWGVVPPIAVDVGEDYVVYVRIENTGCEPVEEFDIKVGAANASLVSMGWETIDTQKHIELLAPLAPGDATVVTFAWQPGMGGEHRCLIAAVNAAGDPLEDISVNATDIALQDLDLPASAFVPTDNSVAQRNITVTGSAFTFGNPFATAVDFAVDFDCNDLPVDATGAVVTLRVPSFGALATAWASVPNVQTSYDVSNNEYVFTFDRCKVKFPQFTVPANTVVDAKLDVSLPVAMTGSWTVDLVARINGVVRDGISVVHTQ